MSEVLRCPLCFSSFVVEERRLVCENAHAFDFAKERSVHLLPQRLRSKAKGDTDDMIRARREFLDGGHYLALQRALASELAFELDDLATNRLGPDHLATNVNDSTRKLDEISIVDVGCGEGTYLGFVVDALQANNAALHVDAFGFDVSGYAIKRAAARHKGAFFGVSDIKCGLPVRDQSVDVVTDIFAPRDAAEFARVLRPKGVLVVVIPAPHHLSELRSLVRLIAVDEGKEAKVCQQLSTHFELENAIDVEWKMSLAANELQALVAMTPSHLHLNDDDRRALAAAPQTEVTASMRLLRFRREV